MWRNIFICWYLRQTKNTIQHPKPRNRENWNLITSSAVFFDVIREAHRGVAESKTKVDKMKSLVRSDTIKLYWREATSHAASFTRVSHSTQIKRNQGKSYMHLPSIRRHFVAIHMSLLLDLELCFTTNSRSPTGIVAKSHFMFLNVPFWAGSTS